MSRKNVWTNADGLTVGFGNNEGTTTKGPTSGGASWLTDGDEYDLMLPNGDVTLSADEITALKQLVVSGSSLATGIVLFNSNEVKTRSSLNDGSDNQIGDGFHDIFVPGGLLGPNGQIFVAAEINKTVDGANKNVGLYSGEFLDDPFGLAYSWTGTSPANWQIEWSIYNANDAASQKWRGSTLRQSGSSAGFITSATPVDTNNSFTLRFAGKWGSASISGEQITVASLLVIGYYGA